MSGLKRAILLWYDGQAGGVDDIELWDHLRRHGFVDGAYACADANTRRRVAELAVDLFCEIETTVGKRGRR